MQQTKKQTCHCLYIVPRQKEGREFQCHRQVQISTWKNWGEKNLKSISHLTIWERTKKIRTVKVSLVYLQDSENSILACQDWHEVREVFWGQTGDIIDLVSREVVVLIFAVTVVVVDVTCTHKKVSAWDMPGRDPVGKDHAAMHRSTEQWKSEWKYMFPTWR